jgi:hypothetical protein
MKKPEGVLKEKLNFKPEKQETCNMLNRKKPRMKNKKE